MSSFGVPSSNVGLDLPSTISHTSQEVAGNPLVPQLQEVVELVGMEEEEMDILV